MYVPFFVAFYACRFCLCFREGKEEGFVYEAPDGKLLALTGVTQLQGSFLRTSVDGGLTWTNITGFPQPIQYWGNIPKIRFVPNNGIVVSHGPVLAIYSSDNGATWQNTPTFNSMLNINTNQDFYPPVMTSKKTWIFFAGTHYLRVDSVGQTDSIPLPQVINQDIKPNPFFVFNDERVLLNNMSTIYESTDDGLSWHLYAEKLNGATFPKASPISDATFYVNYDGYCYKLESENSSKAVIEFLGYGGTESIESFGLDSLFIKNEAGVWRSVNNGKNWISIYTPPVDSFFSEIGKMKWYGDTMIFAHHKKLFISFDFGTTIQEITPNQGFLHDEYPVFAFDANNQLLYANTDNAIVFSSDLGFSWQILNNDLFFKDIGISTNGTLFGVLSGTNTQIIEPYIEAYISRDMGQSWTGVWTNYEPVLKVYSISPHTTIFSGYGTDFYTFDDGWSWDSGQLFDDDDKKQYSDYNSTGGFANLSFNHPYFRKSLLDWRLNLPEVGLSGGYQNIFIPKNDFIYIEIIQKNSIFSNPKLFRSRFPSTNFPELTGTVQKEDDQDCSTLEGGAPLKNWIVKAAGQGFTNYAKTDSLGNYKMTILDGDFTLSTTPNPAPFWEACNNNQTITIPPPPSTISHDLYVSQLMDCPFLDVDLFVWSLERCFENNIHISVCNIGTQTADSAFVEVLLDPYLTITESAMPYDSLGNNRYAFYVGNLGISSCTSFDFKVYVDCDSTILGQTHCVEAHAFPDSLCTPIAAWSGANMNATATCVGDSLVRFYLKNTGTGTSNQINYIIIEDDVVIKQSNNTFGPGQIMEIDCPANNDFLRLEANQAIGNPFSNQIAAWIQGCPSPQANNSTSQFFLDNGWPSVDVECMNNVGSFDPNDKTGFPLGFGSEHLILPNTHLEYVIRFQNTGTATAHKVVLRDTISELLDASTLTLGAASHPYTWDISGKGYLEVIFDKINLPDSLSDAEGSQGFLSFQIEQKEDLPNGSLIENRAGIYFDFNAPILTNTTKHTIGTAFLTVSLDFLEHHRFLALNVWPNPSRQSATIELPNLQGCGYTFVLMDTQGRKVKSDHFCGADYFFQRENFQNGLYFLTILDKNGAVLANGKLVLAD